MAKKELGQHWLFDRESLEQVAVAGELKPDDLVLEVGPGHGTLTKLLSKTVKEVIAVEVDEELAGRLKLELDKTNIKIIQQDILDFDFRQLPRNYKVVANIPYYLTSKLIRLLLESPNPPQLMALLIQQEVAERIVAKPGHMSVLAVSVQYYAEPKITGRITRDKFQPPPEVDSAVIQIERRPKPVFEADAKKLFRLVKAGFGEKRKQLKNSLVGGLHLETGEVKSVLKQAGLKSTARAQELALDDWQKLYQAALNKL